MPLMDVEKLTKSKDIINELADKLSNAVPNCNKSKYYSHMKRLIALAEHVLAIQESGVLPSKYDKRDVADSKGFMFGYNQAIEDITLTLARNLPEVGDNFRRIIHEKVCKYEYDKISIKFMSELADDLVSFYAKKMGVKE